MRLWRRLLALVLCVLLAAAFPLSASAQSKEERVQEVEETIVDHFQKTLWANGATDMHTWCGLLAGYLLNYMGVEAYPNPRDGNKFFDFYRDLKESSGGHRIKAYPASEYTLEEALNEISHSGTRNVYNMLAGFEWTDTEAGAGSGHVVVIYAIIDGMVYAVEGFYSPIGNEGQPTHCTIEEFAHYYGKWTVFDGVIYFGQKEYSDFCEEYDTDLFVSALSEAPLLSQPRNPSTKGQEVQILRKTAPGERLRVSGVYRNTNGLCYYRISEGEQICYLAAQEAELLRVNTENVTVCDVVAPEAIVRGKHFELGGKVTARDSALEAVRVAVTDDEGRQVLSYTLETVGRTGNLNDGSLNQAMDFSSLPEGRYTYSICADVVNHDAGQRVVETLSGSRLLWETEFLVVGKKEDLPEPAEPETKTEPQPQVSPDGWSWDGQTWYYYVDGAPQTGWFCDQGINYYLRKDGSVTTGKAYLGGWNRYFTETGALRTGWVQTEDGYYYMLSNGVAAHGWREIDGGWYYLEEDTGLVRTDSWFEWEGSRYYLLSDGRAATGWVELEEGRFCFREDGRLLAQAVNQGERTYIQRYDEQTGLMQSLAGVADVRNIIHAAQ